MKQFFKFMLASMVGFILTIILFFLFMLAIISGLMKNEGPVKVSDNSVLEIKFEDEVKERSDRNPFEKFNFGDFRTSKTPGLDEILKSISKAKSDDHIKGILLDLTEITAGMATLEEIRSALLDFKLSGKFIYAFSESYTQRAYYLASVADQIFLYPTGSVDFRGLRASLMFFKGTLEKLEVKPEIIRHGKFKSAVEPFMYDKMSDENREQVNVFLGSIWKNMLEEISASRNIDPTELQRIVDEADGRDAEKSLQLKLVDRLAYYDEVLDELKEKTGKSEDKKVSFISLRNYSKSALNNEKFTAKKIAVIYATGDIVGGEGSGDQAGSDRISAALRKARMDSTIKAIVFRINSPGGSALASDVIWREASLAQKAKPLIVSMGDYAASGGYYIACIADTIVARPNTITGSIGVFGLLFDASNMFKNKLGITFDTVKTGRYADIGSINRAMKPEERAIIQEGIEKIYDTFLNHVSEGRGMSKTDVDNIGQGRVWSGIDAKRLGLVDVLGGLNDAIRIAASKANLDSYRIINLPEQKEFFETLVEDLSTETRAGILQKEFGESYIYLKQINSLVRNQGIMTRLPYAIEIER